MNTTTVGVDLAKYLFAVCQLDHTGAVTLRRELRREAFVAWLAQLPAGTIVAMEACSGAHHWARRCREHALQPRLMAAQFVTPFRKSRGSKNDRNDAEAIATAARQGNMRFVAIKTVEQQARLAWHCVREGYKTEHLAVMNRLRGVLAEFGIVIAPSAIALKRALASILECKNLPGEFIELIADLRDHWQQIQSRLHDCDARIEAHARADERSQRLRALTGVGPLSADAMVASVGTGGDFKNGRQLAAWLGLVPRQHSSGGRERLGRISRSGDAHKVPTEKATPEQIWIRQLATRIPFGKLLVAIANKHARQIWAMLARDDSYDPDAWLRHPMVQRNASRKNTLARAA
ncbi:MAG: IS110 family transposase [Gammaproteobacteria bacterium]|nr:MAG: IS110 family transposase [Gammaproteobacteria bacterium]